MLALVLALAFQDPGAARVDSLVGAGDVREALRAALRLVAERPRDARAHLLLGRVHYARPVIGRYAALQEFRTAAALAPRDPEPLYGQMTVGFHLGSDEGDRIAREALLKLFALTPDYRDAWRRFGALYQDPGVWRRAERALARHGDDVLALERRAELATALGEARRADSLLAIALERRAPPLPAFLLRARASFEAGRDSAGYTWYDSALVHADVDSTGVMWDAVRAIASPEETARHAATPPGARRRFFESFWGIRDPNLVTLDNERIAEHFRRLGYARRYFRLLHPQNLFHRSARYRALVNAAQRDYLADLVERAPAMFPRATVDSGRDGPAGTRFALAGMDARGLVYIRHGPPDALVKGVFDPLRPMDSGASPLDVEGWLYNSAAGPLSIGFRRGTASLIGTLPAGDFVFFPVSIRQVRSARTLLETDRTAVPAPLTVRRWSAFFMGSRLGTTDVYWKIPAGTVAVALWEDDGEEVVRVRGSSRVTLAVSPGRYRYGLDVDSAGVLGRARGEITVPAFSPLRFALSSFVLAPADSLLDRATALARMPGALAYAAGVPLAAYTELYGLAADGDGRARYQVRYTFSPERGARPVVFEFVREAPALGVVAERLVIEPGELPAGRYRVTLAVSDLLQNVKSEAVALEITIR